MSGAATGTFGGVLRYLDCLFRHRRLLLGIMAITLVVGVAVVAIRPRVYEATARLWVDTTIEGDHINPYVNPSEVGAAVAVELVKTRSFCLRTAMASGLADELVRRSGAAVTDQERGDLVYLAVSSRTTVIASGPNIVAVAFQYPDPRLAAAETKAIVDEFKHEVLGGQVERAKAAVSFYKAQVDTVQKELSTADTKVADYLATHPEDIPAPLSGGDLATVAADPAAAGPPVSSAAPTDVDLLQLRREVDGVRKRHADLVDRMDKAQLELAVAQQATPNGVRALDQPLVPIHAVPRFNQFVVAGAGGIVAGLLLSLLALLALTAADTSLLYPREVEPALGLRLAGSVPYIE